MEIKNVVFDLGNVLMKWSRDYLYDKVFSGPKEKEYFLSVVCPFDWHLRSDAGENFYELIEQKQKEWPQYKEQLDLYLSRWDEMIPGDIPESVTVLEALKDKVDLFALSNFSAETIEQSLNRFSWSQYFKGIVVSGRIKMMKPEPGIYQYLLKTYSLRPEATLFIDDRIENVEGARLQGMKAYHFTSGPEFIVYMQSLFRNIVF